MTSQISAETVTLQIDGPAATITFDGPPGNPLSLRTARAFSAAATAATADESVRVIRIMATGKAFCVGGDLAEFAEQTDIAGHMERVAGAAHTGLTALRNGKAIVITAIQGVAAGGGLGIALCGDISVAARSAKFRVAYTAAGLSPDCGVSFHLSRALGPARAMDLALTNPVFTAEQAADWGLISRVVPDDELVTCVDQLTVSLAAGSQQALRNTRAVMRAAVGADWSDQLAAEVASIAELSAGADGREGVAAFLAKREPKFR